MKRAYYPVIAALVGICLPPVASAQMDCPPGLTSDAASTSERIEVPEPIQGNLASVEVRDGGGGVRLVRHSAPEDFPSKPAGQGSSIH